MTAGLGIYDSMQYVLPPIATWCVGQACSMASLLLCAGAPDMRHSLPNSRVMIHQPSGQAHVSLLNPHRVLQIQIGCMDKHVQTFQILPIINGRRTKFFGSSSCKITYISTMDKGIKPVYLFCIKTRY